MAIVTGPRPRPAVFLDRDGTLIEDRGHLSQPSEVILFPETGDALRRLQERYLLFIVSNQSGVAKGAITAADVDRVNAHLLELLSQLGVRIAEIYVCPHQRTDNCGCIKPKPYFLDKAGQDFGVDLPASFVIGDHPHDVEFARSVGARGIYVCTGHGMKHLGELGAGEVVMPGIREAADWILSAGGNRGER